METDSTCKECRFFSEAEISLLDGVCLLSKDYNNTVMVASDGAYGDEPRLDVSFFFGCNQFVLREKGAAV